jgi:hypothetical protein
MLNRPREVPTWKIDRDSPNRQVKPADTRALAFIANGVEDLPDIELIPYFEIAHERYNLYWQLT